MELGPIVRALGYHKARFWLIALEVALTLAIVVNCVSLILDVRSEFGRPTGYDEENLITIHTEPFAADFAGEDFRLAVQETDLELLESLPGVRAAVAISQFPLSGGGSATGRRPIGSQIDPISTPYYQVRGDRVLEALGVSLEVGRAFEPSDFVVGEDADGGVSDQPVILSRALADRLFPDGGALGTTIQSRGGEETNVVVGIVDTMHNSWPDWEDRDSLMLVPGSPGDQGRMRYMVRVEPSSRDAVFDSLEGALTASEPRRIVTVETFEDVKRSTYGYSLALVKMLSAVSVLLVLVTSLGIVGLTSFSVTQRTRQIGTRRALGATRGDILRYFLLENWLVTGLGLVIGVGLAYGLGYWLTRTVEAPPLSPGLVGAGMILLWATGIVAALFPAYRATNVSPEVATRTV